MSCTKTDEPIETQLWMLSRVGPENTYCMGADATKERALLG